MKEGDAKSTSQVAPAPVSADVGIVAALPIEVGHLIGRMRDVRKYSSERHTVVEGECAGRLLALIVAGPGRTQARRAGELLLIGHHPRWLVSAGFAGALDPSLKRNAIVRPNELVDREGARLAVDVPSRNPQGVDGFRTGRLVTVDEVVRTAVDKAALRQASGADLVDMESFEIAALCAQRGVRFLSLRVVSDDAQTDMPPEILSIVGPTGGYRVGAALGAIWKRPATLRSMLVLRDRAHQAAKRLAEALVGILPTLA